MTGAEEKIKFKKQVDLFVAFHKKKHEQKIQQNKRPDYQLEEVINQAPPLADDAIDLLFDKDPDYPVADDVVAEVKSTLKKMRETINQMDPKHRFFILDTVNFFSSKIGIAKLISALLVLSGIDQKKAIVEFIFPTFFSIQRNVETLLEQQSLFSKERVHIEKGELYTLVADLARIVVRLIKKDFLQTAAKDLNAVEFFSSAFDPTTFKLNEANDRGTEYLFDEMIEERDEIRRIVMDFAVTIQSHESLYTYSVKRFEYYKAFIASLPVEDRFKEVDRSDISKILAGCFLANDQLKPDDALIESMIDTESYSDEATIEMIREFIDNLSPGNIYRLISRLKVSLQHISKTNFSDEFREIQRFSTRTILKNAWTGFMTLVEKGLTLVSEPVKMVYQQVKRTYESFLFDERQKEEGIKDGMIEDHPSKSRLLTKNLDALSQLSQQFQLVETDVISFRGEHEGATYKDFGYNSQFFLKNEPLMVKFLDFFKNLFSIISRDPKVKVVTYEGQLGITEYYAAYSFSYYLFCFGLTHIKNPKLPVIEEKSIFPYVFVMMENKKKKDGRIASRRPKDKKDGWIYNEMAFNTDTAKLFYEPMYMITHLMPEHLWNDNATQTCVEFLWKQLKRLRQKKVELLFVNELD